MNRTLRRAYSDDSGAALVLALVIVLVFALGLAGLLSFSDASIRTTVALRDQAAQAYDADAAAEAAINDLRKGTFNNAASQNQNCFGSSSTMTLSNFYPGTTGSAPAS